MNFARTQFQSGGLFIEANPHRTAFRAQRVTALYLHQEAVFGGEMPLAHMASTEIGGGFVAEGKHGRAP
jgi:hypothetical protein